jgi:hypothetical protein
MDINWSAFDGILGLILLIVIVWMALKMATRLILGLIIVAVIGVVFFGWHFGGVSSMLTGG